MGNAIDTMKLVVATALLAAVAFAAPRTFLETDAVVPEETMVQTGMKATVESLQKQFQELQAELQDGAKATPGVIEVINDMITLIETDIEVAINDAHVADQTVLDTKMNDIALMNGRFSELVDNLNERATQIEGLIADAIAKSADWKAKSETFTATQEHYMKTYDNQTKTCCEKDNAGVIDVQYTPAYALCDYTVPAGSGCGDRAVAAVQDIITTPFTDGLALYRALVAACNGLTADLAVADANTDAAIEDCQTAKLLTKGAESQTQDEKDVWSARWDRTISNYTGMMADYEASEKRVKSDEVDRKNEWDATQEIKCMLAAYRDGGSFDDATRASCQQGIDSGPLFNIDYPAKVPQLSWDKHVFTEFTDAGDYESTCDARTPAPEFTCVVADPRPYPDCNH